MKSQIDLGLLILRVGAGVLLMSHGFGKLMQLIEGNHQFGDPIGIGPLPSLILTVFAEFFCALLVVLGVKTRWAAVPPLITMIVAAVIVHSADDFRTKEMAILYGVMYLALVFAGGGRYSVDGWLDEKKRGRGRIR